MQEKFSFCKQNGRNNATEMQNSRDSGGKNAAKWDDRMAVGGKLQ